MSHKLPEPRQVTLHITEEEADALLQILLNAPPSAEVPEGMTEALLCNVAGAQRAHHLGISEPPSRSRRRIVRRRRVITRLTG